MVCFSHNRLIFGYLLIYFLLNNQIIHLRLFFYFQLSFLLLLRLFWNFRNLLFFMGGSLLLLSWNSLRFGIFIDIRSKFLWNCSLFSSWFVRCKHCIFLINLDQIFWRFCLKIINMRAQIGLSITMFKMYIFNISKTSNRFTIWSQILKMNHLSIDMIRFPNRRIFYEFYIFFRYVWLFTRNLCRFNKFKVNVSLVLKINMFSWFSLNKIAMRWWFFGLFFNLFNKSIFSINWGIFFFCNCNLFYW